MKLFWKSAMPAIESPLADEFADLLKRANKPSAPVNFQRHRVEEIATQAPYAISVAQNLLGSLTHYGVSLEGKRLLEIGPGSGFGSTLILGERCASVAVADRFLAHWQDDFHPQLYAETQRLLGRPSRWLDAVVAQGGYGDLLRRVQEPAHALTTLGDGAVDVIISNAVLEHVVHLQEALTETFRVTSPGGCGFHQVDFRNHRNFDLPLEHLLLSHEDFQMISAATNAEVGCQHRVLDVANCFTRAGFEVRAVYVNASASAAYLEDFLPRLQRSQSPYRSWQAEELAKISASFFVVKAATQSSA